MKDESGWTPHPITAARFIAADMGVYVDETVIEAAEARGRAEGERIRADPAFLAAMHRREEETREAIERFKAERGY